MSVYLLLGILLCSRSAGAETSQAGRVSEKATSSLAVITSAGEQSTGFVFHQSNYVATTFRVVERARPITVRFSDGTTSSASVRAVDRGHDIALLELASPRAERPPLDVAGQPVLGEPLVAIGHTLGALKRERKKGLLNWRVSAGVVSAVGKDRIQTDAALDSGNRGGPLLNSEGRVVGLVSSASSDVKSGVVVQARHLSLLADNLDKKKPYRGRIKYNLNVMPYVVHIDDNFGTLSAYPLGRLSLERVSRDRYTAAIGLGWLDESKTEEGTLYLQNRFYADLSIGYQKLFAWNQNRSTLPLRIEAGGILTRDTSTEESLRLQGPCNESTNWCESTPVINVKSKTIEWRLRPQATLSTKIGPFRLAYGIAIDPTNLTDRMQMASIAYVK